jgi:hypothetical protein
MKSFTMPLLTIVTAAAVVGMVTVGMQQTYATRDCPDCGEFKKMTHEFEKSVIGLVGNPDEGPQPHLRELLDAYAQDVNRIFLGGPDTIPGLLEQYQQAVLAVFVQPPEPDKQQLHDQIKEFRQLTQAFEKAVIGEVQPPEPE